MPTDELRSRGRTMSDKSIQRQIEEMVARRDAAGGRGTDLFKSRPKRKAVKEPQRYNRISEPIDGWDGSNPKRYGGLED